MKKLLIVVDYQNDFVTGSLAFKKALELEEVLVEKINKYKMNDDEVIFTFDTHNEDYNTTVEGKYLPTIHCIDETYGHDLYGKVKELCDDRTLKIKKCTYPSIDLANFLKDKNYESVEVCGVVTNVCVLSNVIMVKAVLPNVEIYVDSKAVASYNEDLHEKTLDILKGLHINII